MSIVYYKSSDEFEASQRRWFRDRLAEPELIDNAVRLVFRGEFLDIAVPTGGSRQGGYVPCSGRRVAKEIYRQLSGRPGFPDVHIVYSSHREIAHNVEWGPRPPTGSDEARGRFYGYREEAIREFVKSHFYR